MADLSLRDQIAIATLPALITGRSWIDGSGETVVQQWANAAYIVADAMLAARAKGDG